MIGTAFATPVVDRTVDSSGQATITIRGSSTPSVPTPAQLDRPSATPDFQVYDLEVPPNQPKLPSWKSRTPAPKAPVVTTPPPIPSGTGVPNPYWGWYGYPVSPYRPHPWAPSPVYWGPSHGFHRIPPPVNYQNRPINYQNRP